MVTTRLRLHRSCQAKALHWTCALGVLAPVACGRPLRGQISRAPRDADRASWMMKIGASSTSQQIDHTVLAELITRRWKEARSCLSLNSKLAASWRRQSGRGALELHRSRRAPFTASADLIPPFQPVFDGAA